MDVKYDCKYFRGDIPCKPHKDWMVHCDDCIYYSQVVGRILIIKLGAIGDVIRTTPLLHFFESEYPNHEIWWLTYSPEVLPSQVDKKLKFCLENILTIQGLEFDWAINLDKDIYACSLMDSIKAEKKSGFGLMEGKPFPLNKAAAHKYMTGIFDDLSKANTKSYPEEIFELVGTTFAGEEYILEVDNSYRFKIDNQGKKIVGLNTGCGARWTSRLWSEENWNKLIKLLQAKGYYPLLLGGEQEHEKNTRLSIETSAAYLGYFRLDEFIALMNRVDILVTGVTMGLHLGIGLKKKVVLFNNIFNPYEFELYGRGVILQPEKECKCYFKGKCNNSEYFCMDYIYPEKVAETIFSF